jgi:hypothetical protein
MATTNKTKHERAAIVAAAIVLGAAVAQPAMPQDSERLTVDVHDCLSLEKRDERLACFEAQVEAAQRPAVPARGSEPAAPSTAPPAGAAAAASAIPPAGAAAAASANPAASAVPTATATPAPSAAAVASTAAAASIDAGAESRTPAPEGRSGADTGPAKGGSEQPPADIVATVTALRERLPNAYDITLDNGQVWRQSPPMAYPLRPGLEVRLRQTRFGYRLTAPELRGQIQVERVR